MLHSDDDIDDPLRTMANSPGTTTGSASSARTTDSPRWLGNFKPSIRTLSDISKAKKHEIRVTVQNETKVFLKKKYESLQHVLVKAVLWKLFYDDYAQLDIERDIGDSNYLPDVVALDSNIASESGTTTTTTTTPVVSPLFWGESGRMSLDKARDLCQRYPTTHIVWMRWGISMQDFIRQVAPALKSVTTTTNNNNRRQGRFTLAAIPNKNVWELFEVCDESKDGDHCHEVIIGKEDVEWFEMHDYVDKMSSTFV